MVRRAAASVTEVIPAGTSRANAGTAGTAAADQGPPDLDGHLAAWCDALCAAAGLPPLPAGVSALRPRSRRRP